MISGAFRTVFYSDRMAHRVVRIDDLRTELQSEYEALSTAQTHDDMCRLQGRIEILKELIDVMEKGVTASAPDAEISETT